MKGKGALLPVCRSRLLGIIFLKFLIFILSPLPSPAQDSPHSELFLQTLPLQISTATFAELADWCKDLGLPTSGTRKDLEVRLYQYYGLSVPKEEEKEEGTLVQIKSAATTEYYSLDTFEEDYVRLEGGVHLVMEDRKKGNTYTLFADSVLYNRSRKLLSAHGNVRYAIKYEGGEEKFSGSSLLINLDNWEGYFIEGLSLRDRTISGEVLTFRLQGEFVSRSKSDFMLMEEASITSSPRIPANYHLRAGKIWIFGPEEWGVKDATLYVGHIPVFYFPFFFYPSDEVIFHPVFGYRSREGTFIQTTTYLVGNRKQEGGGSSFLQLSDPKPNDRVKERHGIFLKDTEERLAYPDRYAKLLLDVYSRLGIYAGLEGAFPNLIPNLKTLYFSTGVGASRNLYYNTISTFPGVYTPYWEETEGSFRTFWNTSYFWDIELPFRYKAELIVAYNSRPLVLNLLFETFSDPYVMDDFGDRKEQIDWSKLLQGILIEESTSVLKEQLNWSLDGSYTFNTAPFTPWIQTLQLNRIRTGLNWRSKEIPLSKLSPYESVDPTRRFYYPNVLTLPELSLEMSGKLFRYASFEKEVPSKTTPPPKKPSQELRPPWETEEKNEVAKDQEKDSIEKVEQDEGGIILKPPPLLPNVPATLSPIPLVFDVSYSYRPSLVYQPSTYAEPWLLPKDVDYQFSYSTLSLQNLFQLLSQLQVGGKVFQQQNTLSLSHRHREVSIWDDALPAGVVKNLELSAYQYRSFSISDLFTLSTYPLVNTEVWQKSNANYTVNALLFQRSFSSLVGEHPVYEDRYLDFSKKTITQHRSQLNLIANLSPIETQFQMTYTLPPLQEVLATVTSLIWGPSITSVGFTQKKIEDRWVNQPLSIQQRLQFTPNVNFQATYLYDLEEEHPTSLTFQALLWYLQFRFNASYTEPYTYGGVTQGWIKQEKKEFIPTDFNAAISYRYEPDPMWKNRIRLSSGLQSNLWMNLIRYTESSLSVTYDLTFSIYRFLDLKLSTTSKNSLVYQYVPSLAEKVDRKWRNPLVDLLKSFNFFNSQDRYESFFKLSSIRIEAIHYLDDWTLTVSYTGSPELVTLATGKQEFRWNGILGIFLQWKPIPEIKSEFRYDKQGLLY
ncbi:MAG: hypothetical protein SNJ78_02890 [Spirochaetales bacterium]